MTSVLINTSAIGGQSPQFGVLTNQMTAALYRANQAIERLSNATAAASSGYQGVAGTEFEGTGNNFGVVASDTPGEQGQAYSYAVDTINNAWATFWQAAAAAIHQIDQGSNVGGI